MPSLVNEAGAALLGTILALTGCTRAEQERTRELVDEAARQADRGLNEARRELDHARRRYDIDERVAVAREQLERGIDEAADAFTELAEAGREQGEQIGEYRPIEGAAEAIECEGDRCRMDAAFIDRLAKNPSQLTREAILVPATGASGSGLRVTRVRPGSIPALLGLREGDILLEVNGAGLGSFEAIRKTGAVLHGRNEAVLVYERAGARRSLTVLRHPPGPPPAPTPG